MNTSRSSLITLCGVCLILFLTFSFVLADDSKVNKSTMIAFGQVTETLIRPESAPTFFTFVGDIMLARDVESKIRQFGSDYPFREVKESFKAKLLVGNFEAAIPTKHRPTPNRSTTFSVSVDTLDSLVSSGISHLSLANNHSFDFFDKGFANTQVELSKRNFTVFGDPNKASTSSIAYVDTKGAVVALIALNLITDEADINQYTKIIQRASYGSDWQFVYVHWGEEYQPINNERQSEAAMAFIEAGADVIIGHHPHVVQNIELVNGVPVFYSLGNFVFDQYFSKEVQEGLMIEVEPKQETIKFTLIPVTTEAAKAQPKVMTKASTTKFLSELSQRSKTLTEEISNGAFAVQK